MALPMQAQRTAALPQPACATSDVVPPLAPDTVAEQVLDSLGTVAVPSRPGVRYIRNLLAAQFIASASPAQRQAAVARICGVVVGGDHSDGGEDGFYLVRLHGAGSEAALDAAADAMRHMPGVASAQALALREADAAGPTGTGAADCAGTASGGELRVEALKEMIASREADEMAMVNGMGLAGVDSAAVRVVTDGAVCGRVASAIEARTHFTPAGSPFLVLRAGAHYVAFDPTGVNRSFFVVDSAFLLRRVVR